MHRGAITDRHGLPLAIDTTRYDIYVHPELLKKDKQEAAQTLARITHQDDPKKFAHLYKILTAGYPVVTVARGLEREAVDDLQSLNWTGIDIVPRPFRHYPEGQLAAHLLGYVNMDTKGQGGVEQAREEELKDTGAIAKRNWTGMDAPFFCRTPNRSGTYAASGTPHRAYDRQLSAAPGRERVVCHSQTCPRRAGHSDCCRSCQRRNSRLG